MERRKIRVVIFDIGGVTIQWDESMAYLYLAKKTGINVSQIRRVCDRHMDGFEYGRMTEKEFWRLVARELGYRHSLNGNWFTLFDKYVKFNKDTIRLIHAVKKKGYRTATLTNVIRPHYMYNWKSGLYGNFDRVFASCVLHMRKPDPNVYKYIIAKLKVSAQECVFIDDQLVNVQGAKKAGMKAFQFRSAGQTKKELKKLGVMA